MDIMQSFNVIIVIIIILLISNLYLKFRMITAILKIHDVERQLKLIELDTAKNDEHTFEMTLLLQEQNNLLWEILEHLKG